VFLGAQLPPIPYADPWDETIEDRLRVLTRQGPSRRVVYLYERPDTSTFRYRIYNMIQALRDDPEIAATWFAEYEIEHLLPLIERCEALVVCRVRYNERVGRLLARAHSLGIDTVFDVDDLVFDTDYVHLLVDTLDQPITAESWDVWFAMIGRIGATLRLCRRIIVTNDYLAAKAAQFAPDKPVVVVPNFLNLEQLALSDRILQQKRQCGFTSDERIYLGYFSGTPTHNRDFLLIADALARALVADKRPVLRIVGFLDLPPPLAKYADRIDRHPLQDFVNLQRLIGETEINLVPLQDNIFTNCKSELKYFEAAAIGTCTIASPTFAFRAVIRDGVNGWLATALQWTERINAALADREQYREIAENAAAHVRATYSPEVVADTIRTALFGEWGSRPPHQVYSPARAS
jgi:glycosyltransferase involved in cell wall biosynthesis